MISFRFCSNNDGAVNRPMKKIQVTMNESHDVNVKIDRREFDSISRRGKSHKFLACSNDQDDMYSGVIAAARIP